MTDESKIGTDELVQFRMNARNVHMWICRLHVTQADQEVLIRMKLFTRTSIVISLCVYNLVDIRFCSEVRDGTTTVRQRVSHAVEGVVEHVAALPKPSLACQCFAR